MNEITKIILIVAIYFLLLFTAGYASTSILTKVFEDEGMTKLAPFVFIFTYASFMIANLFSPLVKFSEKWLMAMASLFYGVQSAVGFFMFGDDETLKYILAAIAATLSGTAASFLWVNIGRYIHKVCHLYKKED